MNLYLALEYKTGASITGAIKKSAKPELEKLKPYDNLSNEQAVEILEAIKDLLPKAKLELIEGLLYSDDNSTDTSDLESSKPKSLPKSSFVIWVMAFAFRSSTFPFVRKNDNISPLSLMIR